MHINKPTKQIVKQTFQEDTRKLQRKQSAPQQEQEQGQVRGFYDLSASRVHLNFFVKCHAKKKSYFARIL